MKNWLGSGQKDMQCNFNIIYGIIKTWWFTLSAVYYCFEQSDASPIFSREILYTFQTMVNMKCGLGVEEKGKWMRYRGGEEGK